MPSNWPIYSFVIFAFVLGILIPVATRFLGSKISRPDRNKTHHDAAIPKSMGSRVNSRFILALTLALLLLSVGLLLLPIMISFQKNSHAVLGLPVVIALVVFMVIGLFYSVKKGDMAWQESLLEDEQE